MHDREACCGMEFRCSRSFSESLFEIRWGQARGREERKDRETKRLWVLRPGSPDLGHIARTSLRRRLSANA